MMDYWIIIEASFRPKWFYDNEIRIIKLDTILLVMKVG